MIVYIGAKNKFESTMSVEMNGIINNCHMLSILFIHTSFFFFVFSFVLLTQKNSGVSFGNKCR